MSNRSSDWLKQAEADLRHSRHALESEDYEWCCFAAQQAAEKGVKALFLKHSMDGWGHTISALLGSLSIDLGVDKSLLNCAKTLDKHYIPTRYPNGFDSGAPTDFYTKQEGEDAIDCAKVIIEFCRHQIYGS
ncbi:MAG TPA: HEPN domain-containing protein [Spirochaetales bacterium]|nr:HEPN domain-containing protein [Spirochaetales bacterium]